MGFLGPNRGAISFEGSQLTFTPNSQVTISAGEIAIRNGSLVVEGGELALTAMGETTGAVPVNGAFAGEANGKLTIENNEWNDDHPLGLDVSGKSGGKLWIRSGETQFVNAIAWADNWDSEGTAQGVDIAVENLTMNNSIVTSDALEGNSGSVNVRARGDAKILGASLVGSRTYGSGNAGDINLTARNLLIDRLDAGIHFGIFAGVEERATGRGGNLSVNISDTLTLAGTGVGLYSETYGEGDAGDAIITANILNLDGGQISTSTLWGSGRAGNLSINIADRLTMTYGSSIGSTSIVSQGTAGDLNIMVGSDLNISGGSTIASHNVPFEGVDISEFPAGNPGNVKVTVGDMQIGRAHV